MRQEKRQALTCLSMKSMERAELPRLRRQEQRLKPMGNIHTVAPWSPRWNLALLPVVRAPLITGPRSPSCATSLSHDARS